MNISNVKLTKLDNGGTCKGLASITIDGCFVVTGIRLVKGNNGLFIAMPNRKNAQGEYKDICFPVTAEARSQIQEAVINKYNELEEPTQNELEEPTQNDFPSFDDDLPF